MLTDGTDLLLLKLLGKYRWLPLGDPDAFGFENLGGNAKKLATLGLVRISKSGRYMSLPETGRLCLAKLGLTADAGGNRAYENSSALRRRLEAASIMLACLRAGMNVLPDDVCALANPPVFLPSFTLRGRGGMSVMNAASCAGFGRFGDAAHMFLYVGRESGGMYLANELSHLHNLSSVTGAGVPAAMIFAGKSYGEVCARVQKRLLPKGKNAKGFVDFCDAYERAEIPVRFLSLDETGALQLAVMSESDHGAKIARAAFGERWEPRDAEIPEADGHVGRIPLVVGVDADVRRAAKAWETARKLGRKEAMLAALPAQIRGLYLGLLPKDGFVTPLSIGDDVLRAAFGKGFSLHEPDIAPAADSKGGFIHV
jgi:hypothetical protein